MTSVWPVLGRLRTQAGLAAERRESALCVADALDQGADQTRARDSLTCCGRCAGRI